MLTCTKRVIAVAVLLSAGSLFSGCATVGEPDPRDPLESYNRAMFKFNDGIDRAVLKPAAKAYDKVLPGFFNTTVTNFFSNLGDVGNGLNNFLQFKFNDGFSDFGRLIINTTFGLGGLLDIASEMGFPKHNEDFGQTLGAWGVGSGPYLMMPFLGPSTLRDTPAGFVDGYMNPLSYYNETEARLALYALSVLDTRADLLRVEKIADDVAFDRYTFLRNAYLDRRVFLVHDGKPPQNNDLLNELDALDSMP